VEIRGPFAKFVNSPYYSKSEICGGAVTVSFSKYLPWQAMHFLQRSTHSRNVLQTAHQFEISCLGAPFSWLEKPRNRMRRDVDYVADVLMGFHRSTPSNHEKEAPRQEISKRSKVCSKFSRSGWSVVGSASLAKGGTSKKRPSPHLHKFPTRSNKVSPRTLQTALVYTRGVPRLLT
jgi:hypothetical protein